MKEGSLWIIAFVVVEFNLYDLSNIDTGSLLYNWCYNGYRSFHHPATDVCHNRNKNILSTVFKGKVWNQESAWKELFNNLVCKSVRNNLCLNIWNIMLKQSANQDIATILLLSLMKQIFILPQDLFVLLREQFNIFKPNTKKRSKPALFYM